MLTFPPVTQLCHSSQLQGNAPNLLMLSSLSLLLLLLSGASHAFSKMFTVHRRSCETINHPKENSLGASTHSLSSQTMNQQQVVSLNASGGALLLNLTQLVFEHRQLLQFSRRKEEEEAYFVDYIPPARDAIPLPRSVVYILVGVMLVIVATYAIVGHLINDLMHDLADWLFGPKPVEDDSEGGRGEIEEERRLSNPTKQLENDKLRMEKEKDGPLPGFHQGRPFTPPPPPPRSAVAPTYPGDKRISIHSVTFVRPAAPYVTSL